MNDEPTIARASRRPSSPDAQALPGPDPSDGESTDGLRPWETLDPIEEWKERHKCVLCRTHQPEGRQEFEYHLRKVHGAAAKSARATQERVPCKTHCTWICSVCKAEYHYPVVTKSVHSGPPQRSFDRRFAIGSCRHGRYPEHKRAYGKIDGASWPVILYHEGLTFSEQPEQDDPSLAEFIKVKKPRASVKKEIARGGRASRVG